MQNKHANYLEDLHIYYPIDNYDLSFSDYITKNKEIIAKYRIDLDKHAELTISANAPFELLPTPFINLEKKSNKIKVGALLIHGLLDSPFIMKDIGTKLQSQGLLVRSILLPGHGTVPGSLLHIQYEDWIQAVRYGIESLKKNVEKIFLIGFSTGATLCIYETLQDASKIAGLILLSPAFKINTIFDFATNWHKTISWMCSRAQWLHIYEEYDYTKYRSMPFNAVYQLYRLTKALKKIDHSQDLPCPVLMVLSLDDKIISSKSCIHYFSYYTNPKNQMILYSETDQHYTDPRIHLRKSTYPEKNIINFSHPAIPIAPDNPHYGIKGDYPLASHIDLKNNVHYRELDRPSEAFYNAIYQLKLIRYKQQRLTFNPDFEFMMSRISAFIKE